MFVPLPPPPPDEQKPTAAQNGPEVNFRVSESLENGALPADVRRHLIATGYSPEQATEIVELAIRCRAQRYASQGVDVNDPDSLRTLGRRNMILGAALAVGGVVITIGSISLAGAAGYFIVTGGLVVSGIGLFFRGAGQAASAGASDRYVPASKSYSTPTGQADGEPAQRQQSSGHQRGRTRRQPPQSW